MLTINGTSTTGEPNPDAAPHCAFCLRERPPVGKFHLFTVTNSSSIRAIMSGIFGFEFDAADFTVCTPCWSLVQTVDDFRTCCIQVNELGREISRGLKYEDEWFSEGNMRAIYNVRAAIQNHLERIEDYRYVDEEQVDDVVEHNETIDEAQAVSKEARQDLVQNSKEVPDEQSCNIIECEKCLNWFMTTAQIEYHLARCRGPKKPIEEALYVHTCHLCQERFNRPYLLESHLNWHEDKKPYKCRIKCDEKFYGVELRYIHERSCPGDPRWNRGAPQTATKAVPSSKKPKQKPAPGTNKNKFECDICGKLFCKERIMMSHRREIHNPPKYRCKHCGREFRRKFSFNVHLKNHERGIIPPTSKTTSNVQKKCVN
uniref:Zinc finger protein 649 n=1 Tax=Culex pipiens TaxID=7175 RepID=A0A8D8FCG5_CULPI